MTRRSWPCCVLAASNETHEQAFFVLGTSHKIDRVDGALPCGQSDRISGESCHAYERRGQCGAEDAEDGGPTQAHVGFNVRTARAGRLTASRSGATARRRTRRLAHRIHCNSERRARSSSPASARLGNRRARVADPERARHASTTPEQRALSALRLVARLDLARQLSALRTSAGVDSCR